MLAILAIPAGLTYTFGRFAGNQRQGWALFAAASVLLIMSVSVMYWSEQSGNPILTQQGADQTLTSTQSGGNQEGKEVRFGIANSVLWATVTTDTSMRRRQRRARQPDAPGRRHGDAQHRAR